MHLPTPITLRTAALAVLVALGLALTPAITAQAGEDDVNWTVRTASNDFGAERTSYSYTVTPGSAVDDAIVVVNRGDKALDLGVYAADGYTTDSGQFDLLVGGEKSVGVGAWVTGGTKQISVAPGATVEVPFTVDVPDNATPGDYAGGIVTTLTQPDDAAGINVDRRLGIRIALRVGGDIAPSLAIEDMHVDWSGGFNPFAGGDATISYTVHNTGNTTITAQQRAGTTGPFGWLPTAADAVDAPPQLLPGESWDVSIPVHDVPASFFLAATATITPVVVDASGSTNALEPISTTAIGWAVPWTLLVIVIILVALVILIPRLRKRRGARLQAREDARVQEAVDLALENAKTPEASIH